MSEQAAIHLVGFYKDLTGITTSAIAVPGVPGAAFSNLDYGTSKGVEARLEAHWAPDRRVRVGYSLSETIAVVSSVFDSVPRITSYNVCYTKLLRKMKVGLARKCVRSLWERDGFTRFLTLTNIGHQTHSVILG